MNNQTPNQRRKEFHLIDWNDNHTPLRVSYSDKDTAKGLGARWNNQNKLWYVENDNLNQPILAGRYPLFTKAEINLIPETCWYSNLRSMLPKAKWDLVRKKTYADQQMTCEFCRGQFAAIELQKKHPVEAHELWEFDDASHTQILKKVLCLCPDCHLTQHLGCANKMGLLTKVVKHYANVSGITIEQAENIKYDAFQKWKVRSQYEWSLNLDWLYETYPEITEQDVKLER